MYLRTIHRLWQVIVPKCYTQVDKWCTTELYIVWQVMYYRAIHKLTSDVPQNYTEVDQWSTPELYTGWQVMYYRAIHRLTSDVLHSYTQAIHKLTCDVPQSYTDKLCTTELYTSWRDVLQSYTQVWQVMYYRAIHKLTSDVPQCYTQVDKRYTKELYISSKSAIDKLIWCTAVSYTGWHVMYHKTIH